jgi:hypothetical protein
MCTPGVEKDLVNLKKLRFLRKEYLSLGTSPQWGGEKLRLRKLL